MKVTPWTKVALYDTIMRHVQDAARPGTRVRRGAIILSAMDPDRRRSEAIRVAGRLTFILAHYDMPRFPA